MQQAEPHHESWCGGEKEALLTRRLAAGSWPLSQSDLIPHLRKGPSVTKRRFDGAAGSTDKDSDDNERMER